VVTPFDTVVTVYAEESSSAMYKVFWSTVLTREGNRYASSDCRCSNNDPV